MKLSTWAKEQGISYTTAYSWFKAGRVPNAKQYDNGTILIEKNFKNVKEKNIIYCRVSNQLRKKELNYQIERCENFALKNGIVIHKVYKEIASGMNDKRKQFIKMLDENPTLIIIENKDRLTRFGFNYLNYLLLKLNCKIIVINEVKEDEEDLIKDMISIITSFCCRLYGLRRGHNKINKIKQIINNNE
jgi:predicted site-specific integrase-resolvase